VNILLKSGGKEAFCAKLHWLHDLLMRAFTVSQLTRHIIVICSFASTPFESAVCMTENVRKLVQVPEPWKPAHATERIRMISGQDSFSLSFTRHAEERMEQRGITTLDLMFVLQNGHVLDEAENSTSPGLYKYRMISATPNSNRREIRVVLIPSIQSAAAKIVTVMWADEPVTGARS
jgi:Domain of unknown function (DUF4258)